MIILRKEIEELVQKREDLLGDYVNDTTQMEENSDEIDELAEKIWAKLREGAEHLDVDFVLETLTHLGCAPSLVNDDGGRWAVAKAGMNSLGDGDGTMLVAAYVAPDEWSDTVREAIKKYLEDDE